MCASTCCTCVGHCVVRVWYMCFVQSFHRNMDQQSYKCHMSPSFCGRRSFQTLCSVCCEKIIPAVFFFQIWICIKYNSTITQFIVAVERHKTDYYLLLEYSLCSCFALEFGLKSVKWITRHRKHTGLIVSCALSWRTGLAISIVFMRPSAYREVGVTIRT